MADIHENTLEEDLDGGRLPVSDLHPAATTPMSELNLGTTPPSLAGSTRSLTESNLSVLSTSHVLAQDPSMHEHVPLKSANRVVQQLGRVLSRFAMISVYVCLVQTYLGISFLVHDLPQASTSAALVVLGRWIVLLMINSMLVVMALCGSHHFQAAAVAKSEDEKTGRHLEKGTMYVTVTFNILTMGIRLKTMLDLTTPAAFYPGITAVVAWTAVAMAIFWVAGFGLVQIWYGGSKWARSSHYIGLLSASPEEMKEIPAIIKFWLFQVFGRISPVEDEEAQEGGTEQEYKFEWMLEHYKNVSFTKGQLHVLKLLPEAMMYSAAWEGYRVYAGVLLLITYGIAHIWLGIVQMILVIVKNTILFGLILAGALLFDRAVHSNRSDMENLVRGYEALVATFNKISFMLFMTLTISLIIDIVKLVV